jgi:carboxyl-terminal processing protease
LRPLAVFGVAGGVSLAAFHLAGGTPALEGNQAPVQMSVGSFVLGAGYDLERLDLLGPTLYYVEENYVEPSRVDYEAMYVEALEAVERRVPVTMFRREPGGSLLHLEVGDHRTVVEVEPIHSRKQLQKGLREVAGVLKNHLEPDDIPDVPEDGNPFAEVEYALVNGILSTLDPHSVLLPPQDSKEMDVENQGEFGGLGIVIVDRDGKLTIEYPLPDTPAFRVGLQSDDHIVRIDGETTINMSLDDAVTRLRGRVGDPVTIEVMREGLSTPLKITIIRANIPINPVEADVLEGAIGYISIKSFHAAVESDLHEELTRMTRETGGLKGLVLDLRDNPGGYLTQAVAVADTFLERGMIVAQVAGSGTRDSEENAHAGGTEPFYPIVVLVNANSASASEIVAGALRNNDRAVIVGERTFGKGSVQNLHEFVDDSKLKLTISKYLTPGDRSIQSVGIPADIELVPINAEWHEAEEGEGREPVARVYWRERVRREADLDQHLEVIDRGFEEPAYSIRYHRPVDIRRRSAELDLSNDYEVQFARDVLLSSPSWRRGEILAALSRVVGRHQLSGERDVEEAFGELGIDWSSGSTPAEPSLEVRFDLGEDSRLIAGQEERVGLEVTNIGSEPLYRLVGISESENENLDGREFVFGHLAPGVTLRFGHRVRLVDGYPTEMTPVTFSFRDASGDKVATVYERVPVEGRALPSLAWSWTVDDTEGGDGDGMVEVGELLHVELSVENVGDGSTDEAFARIKNLSGRAMDIVKGTLEPGYMVAADGARCEGTVQADATVYPDDCVRSLAPGETWSGAFEVKVNEVPDDRLAMELAIGDARAYDFASIVRGGFFSYFVNHEELELTLDAASPPSTQRVPPAIAVTRAPEVSVDHQQVTLSGVVSDEQGVSYVMVFHGEDKVFYDGTGRRGKVRSVPYTASVRLEPGLNTLIVLAADLDGYTSTRSVVTYFVDPDLQAKVGSLEEPVEEFSLEEGAQ